MRMSNFGAQNNVCPFIWNGAKVSIKAYITHNIFAHNIEIKRPIDKKMIFLQNTVVTF